jgi:hypothetical protein
MGKNKKQKIKLPTDLSFKGVDGKSYSTHNLKIKIINHFVIIMDNFYLIENYQELKTIFFSIFKL